MHIHIVDIIASALALLFIILGLKRGFVEEAIRLGGIVIAFFAGLGFYKQLAVHLTFLKLSGSIVSVISFLLIFLVSLLVIILLGMLIRKIIHLTVLGWVDRICGGIVGFFKAFFLVWIVIISIASLPIEKIKLWASPSITYSFFMAISPTLKIYGLTPSVGPVQNILKANPLPSLMDAYNKSIDKKNTSEEPKETQKNKKQTQPPKGK